MYINTFKYTPKDVSCQLCTEYVKKLGCTSSSQSPLISVSADGENCDRSLAPPLPTKSATLRGPRTCCPWLAERIEAGVVGYREAVLETFPHERRLFQRLNLLIKHYPGRLWSNEQHERRMQYQRTVQGYRRRRDTNAYRRIPLRKRRNRSLPGRRSSIWAGYHGGLGQGLCRSRKTLPGTRRLRCRHGTNWNANGQRAEKVGCSSQHSAVHPAREL